MELPRTTSKRPWLERLSLTLGGALVALGGISLLAWWLQIDELLQPISDTAPVRANGALCFLLIGAALLSVELNRPRWASIALFPALVSAATLAEQLLDRD